MVGPAAAWEAAVEAIVPVVAIDPVAVVAADESAEETLAEVEVIGMEAMLVAVPVAAAVVEYAEPVAAQVAAVGSVVTP